MTFDEARRQYAFHVKHLIPFGDVDALKRLQERRAAFRETLSELGGLTDLELDQVVDQVYG